MSNLATLQFILLTYLSIILSVKIKFLEISLTVIMFSETSHTEKTIQMFMPEGKLDLGTPPRHCYPLVIFLIRDTPENSTLHPDETVSLHDMIYHFN